LRTRSATGNDREFDMSFLGAGIGQLTPLETGELAVALHWSYPFDNALRYSLSYDGQVLFSGLQPSSLLESSPLLVLNPDLSLRTWNCLRPEGPDSLRGFGPSLFRSFSVGGRVRFFCTRPAPLRDKTGQPVAGAESSGVG